MNALSTLWDIIKDAPGGGTAALRAYTMPRWEHDRLQRILHRSGATIYTSPALAAQELRRANIRKHTQHGSGTLLIEYMKAGKPQTLAVLGVGYAPLQKQEDLFE